MSEGYKQWHLLSVPIEGPWKNPRRLRFISKQLFQSPAPDDMKEEQEAIPERTAGSLEADLGFQTEDHQEEPILAWSNICRSQSCIWEYLKSTQTTKESVCGCHSIISQVSQTFAVLHFYNPLCFGFHSSGACESRSFPQGEILSQRVVWTKCKPAISIQKVA
ncbi:hypothetical protein MJO28_005529 [Puccinia striiformis f. sp. tritici]|uniref:Uncharacterized protein n=1 Tax=Puccinia striiformis f. sp. tritici TaxID=168172 RepID=A0ACC0ELQ2_9BASI|nr:hypothetical protein MJO28_005529 [Puccinia striiformis f. sp. tritici]